MTKRTSNTKVPRRLVSFAEALAKLPVGERQFRRWIAAGKVSTYEVEGTNRLRFDPQELESLASTKEANSEFGPGEVDVPRAAELLGVSDRTLRRWIAAEVLPSRRLWSGQIAISETDVQEMIRPRHRAS
jgi:excisionase family DNA binding protein